MNGRLRVGASFFARRGVIVDIENPPRGVVDHLADLANDDVDLTRVAPAVFEFFERTADLELHVRTRWRLPFFVLYAIFRPIFALFGQLVLPLREATIRTRVFALAEGCDGRPRARAIVRSYVPTGRTMQAIAYAVREGEGRRAMSAAFPLPLGQLLGILHLEHAGASGLALTSHVPGAGIWMRFLGLALRLPLGERLELQPGGDDGALIEGTHEQRIFGILVVRHVYRFFSPSAEAAPRRRS